MKILLAIIITYLYGSIPFSYLIGKIIYQKDITKLGSQNIGGSNLGRTCGKPAFILGFILDASKGAIVVLIASCFVISPLILAPFALLGHGFSIFMKFKGGKGISTACGFVLAYSFWGAIFALSVFVLVLYLKKYVSLASLVAIGAYIVYSIIYQPPFYTLFIIILYIVIIYLHRGNIQRIKAKTERKITWM
ncbi:MAG: glycerol-3-phosphate 1-O-acyltransferase PlsY [Mycoplasmatales bacterium]